ncbi:hypothetical protein F5Y03DRAFT_392056 [Xylaria venustula]|nr:hypothetical protein F5Y03DRAFT_392056 [Xylaria venustula]
MSPIPTTSPPLRSPEVEMTDRTPLPSSVCACPPTPLDERIKLVNDNSPNNTEQDASSKINTMKVYMDGKLYSIFDRSTKSYIYKADRDAEKGWRIVLGDDGLCILIEDEIGQPIYVRPKERARY